MEPIPANVMSPDEMLRAYAERKKSMSAKPLTSSPSLSATTGPINYPKAVVKKRSVRASIKEVGSNTMRVLYNATTRSPTNNTSDDAYIRGVVHGSADSRTLSPIEPYDDEDVGDLGTVNEHPFGYHPNAYAGGSYAIEEDEEDGAAVYVGHAC